MHENEPRRPLRLWPGVAIVSLQWLLRFAVPAAWPGAMALGLYAAFLGGPAVLVWWAFFSRAPRLERWGGGLLMVLVLSATPWILHESLATAMFGYVFPIYAIPVLSLAFVVWAAIGGRLARVPRRVTMVATILLACGGWAAVRTHGIAGGFDWDFGWRWAATAEERLLERERDDPPEPVVTRAEPLPTPAWPGFRGPARDGVVRGVRIATDWSASPPLELWRRPVGPGWSSIAVAGDLLYTQEQRGEDEVVSCYRLDTGEPVWRHRVATRFWEAMAGAGPRATPTVSDGRVFALGATGRLSAVDAATGAPVWSRDVVDDAGVELPLYGIAASPLVAEDLVVVSAAGRLAAYDRTTGEPRWLGPAPGATDSELFESYGSPQPLAIDGETQILVMDGAALIGVAPADGAVLWRYAWPGLHLLQPARTDGDAILISNSGSARGIGMRRLRLTRGADGWTVEERWTSTGLKPYFNDFVVHEQHAYGYDGGILACIDLQDGARRWKGGRYGLGQLLLLADQDLLLVQSERGELALVRAVPDGFTELARVGGLGGKTWSHPVLVGDRLLVRNDREMGAFRLPAALTATRPARGSPAPRS